MRHKSYWVALLFALVGVVVSCGPERGEVGDGEPLTFQERFEEIIDIKNGEEIYVPDKQVIKSELNAPCSVRVRGYGRVDIEEDYIPNVIACENGNAPPEALKAAAVMARGFVYYKTQVEGRKTLRNSQKDQVYRCKSRPNGAGPEHFEAARATRGMYVEWKGHVVAPFYVAGNVPTNPSPEDPITSCMGTDGEKGLNTEPRVTYNYGKFGCDVEQTSLGHTPEDCSQNPYNRGAASQNGQACLAQLGWEFPKMLEFYYGADIDVAQVESCPA